MHIRTICLALIITTFMPLQDIQGL